MLWMSRRKRMAEDNMSWFSRKPKLTLNEIFKKAEEVLGHRGRMMCGSKSAYFNMHPDNVLVFNAVVCIKKRKIWCGDLDVTRDEHMLKALAEALGQKVYVLRESDGCFGGYEDEESPKLRKAVASF